MTTSTKTWIWELFLKDVIKINILLHSAVDTAL